MGKRKSYEERLIEEIIRWAKLLTAAGKGKTRFIPDNPLSVNLIREGHKKYADRY